MARAGDMKIEVTLDRQARDSIRSLVKAIDYLAATINSDAEWEDLGAVDDDPNANILRRLVEDVKKRDDVRG